jgi:Leucine-rich repeat (LRR) protein
VLILSKNFISSIPKNNFDSFKQLDVLDLHDNRLSGKLDFSIYLKKLTNLRILNLSGNQLEEIEITCSMMSLVELNLRGNKIKNLKIGLGVKGLKEIQFD